MNALSTSSRTVKSRAASLPSLVKIRRNETKPLAATLVSATLTLTFEVAGFSAAEIDACGSFLIGITGEGTTSLRTDLGTEDDGINTTDWRRTGIATEATAGGDATMADFASGIAVRIGGTKETALSDITAA